MLSRDRRERGSVLMLMPAGVLIFIILAAIAVDFSHLYLERRELHSAAGSAANDAAALAIDADAIRGGESLENSLNLGVAATAAQASLAAEGLTFDSINVEFVDQGRVGVRVTLSRRVDYIFAAAVPGGPDSKVVTATAFAVLANE